MPGETGAARAGSPHRDQCIGGGEAESTGASSPIPGAGAGECADTAQVTAAGSGSSALHAGRRAAELALGPGAVWREARVRPWRNNVALFARRNA